MSLVVFLRMVCKNNVAYGVSQTMEIGLILLFPWSDALQLERVKRKFRIERN